ncbi:heterokaryon incompatibility protein-domain-containing protein, partial [Halenospora varia]
YEPLDTSKDEFRLLRILPASLDDSQVRCKLTTAMLSNPRSYSRTIFSPEQIATHTTIILNDSLFDVTANLAAFLATARQQSRDELYWIDAICINQKDISERNRQVLRIGTICSIANSATIWLGPATEESDLAVDFINFLAERSEDLHLSSPPTILTSWLKEDSEWLRASINTENYVQRWRSLISLLQRSWWQRI